jgi:hypothetical protein
VRLYFAELFAWCDLHASRCSRAVALAPRYFDRQGFPIPARDGLPPAIVWACMQREQDYSCVAWDELPDRSYVSTVWLGLDHSFGGSPLIFETMRFAAEMEELESFPGVGRFHPPLDFPDPMGGEEIGQLRYRTEEEALAAHHEIVRRLRIRLGH